MRTILALMLMTAVPFVAAGAIGLMSNHVSLLFSVQSEAARGIAQMSALVSRASFVGIVYACAIGTLIAASLRPRRVGPVVGLLLLIIEAVDVYSYRAAQYHAHMLPIEASDRGLFTFAEKPFAVERTRDPMSSVAFRTALSRLASPIGLERYEACVRLDTAQCYYDFEGERAGVLYNTIEPVVGLDPCRSILRVDFWLPSVDVFYRAVNGLPLHDLRTLPQGYERRHISFPVDDKRVDKIIGCGFPKLQLFSSPTVITDEEKMAGLIRSPDYNGDLLLVSGPDYRAYARTGELAAGTGETPQVPVAPGMSTRVAGTITVLRASANTLVVRTTGSGRASRYWLYYADAWHPFWHAEVDGVEVPIVRANFGFKAVPVPNGVAVVKFVYQSRLLSTVWTVAQALLTATMLTVVVVAGRVLFDP